jgi:hypothetical protein
LSLWELIIEAAAEIPTVAFRRDKRPYSRGQKITMALALVVGAVVLVLLVRFGWARWP